jgi:hypothetical protein
MMPIEQMRLQMEQLGAKRIEIMESIASLQERRDVAASSMQRLLASTVAYKEQLAELAAQQSAEVPRRRCVPHTAAGGRREGRCCPPSPPPLPLPSPALAERVPPARRPLRRHWLSLYANITSIRWDYASPHSSALEGCESSLGDPLTGVTSSPARPSPSHPHRYCPTGGPARAPLPVQHRHTWRARAGGRTVARRGPGAWRRRNLTLCAI